MDMSQSFSLFRKLDTVLRWRDQHDPSPGFTASRAPCTPSSCTEFGSPNRPRRSHLVLLHKLFFSPRLHTHCLNCCCKVSCYTSQRCSLKSSSLKKIPSWLVTAVPEDLSGVKSVILPFSDHLHHHLSALYALNVHMPISFTSLSSLRWVLLWLHEAQQWT